MDVVAEKAVKATNRSRLFSNTPHTYFIYIYGERERAACGCSILIARSRSTAIFPCIGKIHFTLNDREDGGATNLHTHIHSLNYTNKSIYLNIQVIMGFPNWVVLNYFPYIHRLMISPV